MLPFSCFSCLLLFPTSMCVYEREREPRRRHKDEGAKAAKILHSVIQWFFSFFYDVMHSSITCQAVKWDCLSETLHKEQLQNLPVVFIAKEKYRRFALNLSYLRFQIYHSQCDKKLSPMKEEKRACWLTGENRITVMTTILVSRAIFLLFITNGTTLHPSCHIRWPVHKDVSCPLLHKPFCSVFKVISNIQQFST